MLLVFLLSGKILILQGSFAFEEEFVVAEVFVLAGVSAVGGVFVVAGQFVVDFSVSARIQVRISSSSRTH